MSLFRAPDRLTWIALLPVVATLWFYAWTVVPDPGARLVHGEPEDYYNYLTSGFVQGHLWMDVPSDPFLATLPNPWDPAQHGAHGVVDASYYQGHFYLYYGVTPVALLFLPFRWATGQYLNESISCVWFAAVGFLASAAVLVAAKRRYFPSIPNFYVSLAIATCGLGSVNELVLRRVSFREVCITCGYACCMLGIAGLYRAMQPGRRVGGLVLASAGFALAVGCRPLYALICPILLLPLWLAMKESGAGVAVWRRAAGWRLLLAALLPLGIIGLALAGYNFLRFESPTEFGLRYQIWNENPATTVRFAWRFAAYNLRAFWFSPASWGHYFPFINVVGLPPAPSGYYGSEDPFGLITNFPFVLLALGLFGLVRRPPTDENRRLRVFALAVIAIGLVMSGALLFFQAALVRYMLDFAPMVSLAASLGFFAWADAPRFSGRHRWSLTGTATLLCLYSVTVGLLASLRHNELFREEHPAVYRSLVHRADALPLAWDRLTGRPSGPLVMTVVLPPGRLGKQESLLVTGRTFLSDYLIVYYCGPDLVQFGLVHTSRGTFFGQPVHVDYSKPHVIRVDLGSLYPPPAGPYFDHMEPEEAQNRQMTVSVALDGALAFYLTQDLYDAVSVDPEIGGNTHEPFSQFSGKISDVHRLGDAGPLSVGEPGGTLTMHFRLWPFTGSEIMPLLASGVFSHGDVVYLKRITATQLAIGYLHSGASPLEGPAFTVDPDDDQEVTIDAGFLRKTGAAPGTELKGAVTVTLNGRIALGRSCLFYACAPQTVRPGLNLVPSVIGFPKFRGDLLSVTREAAAAARQSGTVRLRVSLPPFTGVRNEPLVCTGEAGKADLVFIRYLAADRIAFGFDHWSLGGPIGRELSVVPGAIQEIEMDWDGLHPDRVPAKQDPTGNPGTIVVRVNHVSALSGPVRYYPAAPASVAIGINAAGASSATDWFTGQIESTERE